MDELIKQEPLNSDDDVSEEEQADLFDTDNVVVCQYDKVRMRGKQSGSGILFFESIYETKPIRIFRSQGLETNGSST